MAGVKNQVKWVVKHFSSLVLLALVAAAGVAYFTTRLSIAHFTTLVFVVVVAILLLAYYGFMNVCIYRVVINQYCHFKTHKIST